VVKWVEIAAAFGLAIAIMAIAFSTSILLVILGAP